MNSLRKLKKIYIEITNACNLKCSFCPPHNRKVEFMKSSGFENILKQIKPFSDYINLHIKGEPLLHPELKTILDLSNKYNLFVNITTNGTLLIEKGEILLQSGSVRQVNVSVHSFGANESISSEFYTEEILRFAEEALQKSKIIISLRFWNLDENSIMPESEKKIINDILKKMNVNKEISGKIDSNGIKIKERLYINYEKEFVWPDISDKYFNETGFCLGLRDQAGILVDGTVVPCCLDAKGITNLGNIFTKSFSEIINSERANSIYKGFSENKAVEMLCKKCRYKERFKK